MNPVVKSSNVSGLKFHENNFDLIRLFAAFQVATLHIFGHLGFQESNFYEVTSYFPGVPVFFFVSGFLVPRSLERIWKKNGTLYHFSQNRILRLYPALWVCFVASVAIVLCTGYFSQTQAGTISFALWAFAQNSFFQFYNPDFMRGYGVGVLNGSLWTISVEIQFYILTPLIVFLVRSSLLRILLLTTFFMTFNIVGFATAGSESVLIKLFNVSFVPWIYMFLLGYLFCQAEKIKQVVLSIPFIVLALIYVTIYSLTHEPWGGGNNINPAAMLVLCCLILKSVYTMPNLSRKLLGANDISYGIYIYHMPIVNTFVYLALPWPKEVQVLSVYGLVILAAITSWVLVEKRALKFKTKSSRS